MQADTSDTAAAHAGAVGLNRPDHSFRGFAGTVAAGEVRPGQDIAVLPSGLRSKVARIVTADGDLGRSPAPARPSR